MPIFTTMKKNFIVIILLALCPSLFSQEWSVQIDLGCMWGLYDNISVDNGESVLCVGHTSKEDGIVVKIDKDGAYVDRVVHLPGMILSYYSAVQLDNGNYMVFGVCDDSLCDPHYQRYIQVDIFDSELEPVSSRTYDVNDGTFECFSAANLGLKMIHSVLSRSGTVILAAAPAYYLGSYYRRALQLYELDREGNILVQKPHPSDYVVSIAEITYEPHSDNLLVAIDGGSFPNSTGVPGIYVVDTSLEVVAKQDMRKVQGGWGFEVDDIEEISTDGKWIDGDRLILNTQKSQLNRYTFYYASLYVVDSALHVYGELRLPPYDSCTWIPSGTSTAYIDDSTIFAVTHCAENVYADYDQTNVILVDKNLNLLGRKTFKDEGFVYLPEPPASFNDGGCLIAICKRKGYYDPGDPQFQERMMKFRREDIEITWDVVHEDGSETKLAPYPNPTGGIVNIPIPENIPNNARILLFDAGGIKSLDKPIGQAGNLIRLDTGNLASGLYLYRIVVGNGTVAEGKFIKN